MRRAEKLANTTFNPGVEEFEITTTRCVRDRITNVMTHQIQRPDGSWSDPDRFSSGIGGSVDYEGVQAVMAKVKELDNE